MKFHAHLHRVVRRYRRRVVQGTAVCVAFATLVAWLPTSGANYQGTTSTGVSAAAAGPVDFTLGAVVSDHLLWWLDASETSTLYSDLGCTTSATSGSAVRCWKDRRAGFDKVTADTTAPVWSPVALNGNDVVRFSGNSGMNGPDLFGGSTSRMTVFIVERETVRIKTHNFSLNGIAGGTIRFYLSPWNNGSVHFDPGNITRDRVDTPTGVLTTGVASLLVGWKDGGASLPRNYVQVNRGVTYVSTDFTTGGTTGGMRLGSVPNYFAEVDFAEILVFDETLTTTEREAVASYLANKWGTP